MKIKFAILFIGTLSFGANANLIEPNISITDYLTQGDANIITDHNTGLSWLSLRVTDGLSYEQVAQALDTTYAGWYLPSNEQVTGIMNTMFPDIDLQRGLFDSRDGAIKEYSLNFSEVFGGPDRERATHFGVYYDENLNLQVTGSYQNENGNYAAVYGLEFTDRFDSLCTNRNMAVINDGVGVSGVWLVNKAGSNQYSSICGDSELLFTGSATLEREFELVGGSNLITNVSVPFIAGLSLLFLFFGRLRKNPKQ